MLHSDSWFVPLLGATLVVAGCQTPPAVAESPAAAVKPGFTMLHSSLFFDDGADFKIIGGVKADPESWPATFIIDERCTSTAIGESVVLTAAHCVADGATGTVDLRGAEFRATCDHHPGYHDGVAGNDPSWEAKVSPDFALCSIDGSLEVEAESVNTDPESLSPGLPIQLLGFGCNKDGGTDRGFGVLYEGSSAVQSVPAGSSYYTTIKSGAAVCFGDSGGGAYLYRDDNPALRVLMGVNSRGHIKVDGESLLSTTSVAGFQSWAAGWARDHGHKICGLHEKAKGCRAI